MGYRIKSGYFVVRSGMEIFRVERRKDQMPENKYYAHTKNRPDGSPAPQSEWQPLKEHLQNVAALAKKFAESARLGDKAFAAAEAAGIIPKAGNTEL